LLISLISEYTATTDQLLKDIILHIFVFNLNEIASISTS
jgi:hypothetical protein